MANVNPSNELLLIRCPSCGQRFNVEEEFRGRLVECGECDHQFEINDGTILRGKKFYPGERKDPLLEHVHKADKPIPLVSDPIADFAYAGQGATSPIEPTSPVRALLGVIGVFIMIITAAYMIMGAARGGVLDGVTTEKRLIMAGFSGLLGLVLLVLANPKSRLLAIGVGALLAGGLCSLPLVFTDGSTPLRVDDDEVVGSSGAADPEASMKNSGELSEYELRELIEPEPLEREIERLENEGSKTSAVGLWLRNLQYRNKLLVRDYVFHETDADPQTHFYNREDSMLLVVTGVDESLEQMAAVAAALGKVVAIHEKMRVVEVLVDNKKFLPGPVEKLTNPEHPEYYLLNKVELESIDLDRVEAAVKRIAEVEPVLFRRDISMRLVELLKNDWISFKDDVCRALLVWAEDGNTTAGSAALDEIRKILDNQQAVSEDLVALAVKQHADGLAPVLLRMWESNPTIWERWLVQLGQEVEKDMIAGFSSYNESLRQSAIRILGEVGGNDSLALLEKEAGNSSLMAEAKILIRNAIRQINVRLLGR